MSETFPPLKVFSQMTTADCWRIVGGSGTISQNGDTTEKVQRRVLGYICAKVDITAEVLAYYETTPTFDADDIKADMSPGTLFEFPAGTWDNAGLSYSEQGKTMIFSLTLELKVS